MENISSRTETYNKVADQYIVAIGASAGGLEAINELFDNMPSSTGCSFIIIQHLSPDYRSLMGELLSKHTQMQVFEAEEGMVPRPNCIYLIPARKTITMKNGKLKLEEKVRDHMPNKAIDIFFDSLAKEKTTKAIGIILSGTGTDGTRGMQAIKNAGGTTVVQDPITAQFDGMPNSAVASGFVDLILSPELIGEELLDFIQETPFLKSFNELTNQEEATLRDILELVYKTTGNDFSNYKRPTINRRLAKRMAERNIRNLGDYYNYLINHKEEVTRLCKEFLLHVTRFFRDEEAFEVIKTNIIPDIVNRKEKGEIIKLWTVGCSTGEEAYSLAILFDEWFASQNLPEIEVKIFASDIDQETIEIASRGLYTEEQVKCLSKDRLQRYFVKENAYYRISASIRRMIVFARHDITRDPPFSKIDLISCRNMLIYMNPLLQKTILQKFHFAINSSGYLFLGPSENISILKEVLAEVDKKWKIYQCVAKTKVMDQETFHSPFEKTTQSVPVLAPKSKNAFQNMSEIFKETLLEEYDYAGIFIDRDFEVKQAIGNFKKFLDFPEEHFNFNLLKMVPTDLSIALSTGIRKAMKENEKVVQKSVKIAGEGKERTVTIIIKPYLTQKVYLQPFLFIVLKEDEIVAGSSNKREQSGGDLMPGRVAELEMELRDTKENLQALIEEVESSNEELQSSNEEIISSNEELQSTNEELQSLNEELHTVNAEHQLKIKELIELNDDLNNYFLNTNVGQILIDKKLIIRKFTDIATKQVNLIASDVGRSIADISTNMHNLNFLNDIKAVIQDEKMLEREITMDDDKTYLMRIAPYVRLNKEVDGVVVNFIDVSEVKKINNILDAVLNSSTSGIISLRAERDANGIIVDFTFITANNAALSLLGMHETLAGKKYSQIYGDVEQRIFTNYVHVVETGATSIFEHLNPKTHQWFEIIGVKITDGLVVTFNDITVRKTATEQIAKSYEELKDTTNQLQNINHKLEQSNMDLLQFASVASHDLKEPLRKIQAFGNLLEESAKQKLDPSELNYLNKVIKSSRRMQTLIEDILTLSRLSENDTPHAIVDLNVVVAQIIDDLEISIKEKNATIVVHHLPVVLGIPGQMHQLFQNIISNAIKFNEASPAIEISEEIITAEVQREFRIRPELYFGISIQDNGIGFDERFRDKIFGIFQRLDKTTYQGTGIGLAIVKKIVDNHKGYIKAISKPGDGTRFVILLPK